MLPTMLLLSVAPLSSCMVIPSTQHVADVGIIGAGPAGLALAHAMINEGHSVRIFERRNSFRPVGAAVFMHPFALNSLRTISPALEGQLQDVCTQIHTLSFTTLSPDAPTFKLDKLGDAPDVLGAPFVSVRFWDMLQALRIGLPDDCFAFDHQLDTFEQHADSGVTLHFNSAKPPCSVRFLIDAGGIRSAARKQLVGDERIPRLRATFSVLSPNKVAAAHAAIGGQTTAGELAFVAGEDLSVVSMGLDDGTVMWSQTDLTADPHAPIALGPEELRSRLDEQYDADWPDTIRAYASATELEDTIETTVCELPVSWRWGGGDVTLLGDAAHAQLPALGLGVSTAFGDIEVLVKQVRRHGLSRKALRWYERSRQPACAALQLMSRAMYGLNKVSAFAGSSKP